MEPLFLSDEGLVFGTLETDEEKFEYASYIVNTPEADRPEIDASDAKEALAWLKSHVG